MADFYLNARQYGDKILVKAIEDGKKVKYEVPYTPYLFVPAKDGDYKSVFGEPCKKMDFGSIRDAKDFIKKYEDIDNFQFFGMTNFVYPFMNDQWPGRIQYDRDLVDIVSLDIETMADDGFPNPEKADKEVTAITLGKNRHYKFLSIKDYTPHMNNVEYIQCSDEKELLYRFIDEWRKLNPDVATGWNVEHFDIPYMVNRIKNVLGSKFARLLSPFNIIQDATREFGGRQVLSYDIYGVEIMDYLAVYKKWSGKMRESYKLDHIANVELGIGKVDYSEYGTLHDLYEKNFQLYAEYNIRDTTIVDDLDDKLKLMDLVLALAYESKINYEDAYTSVKMWDVIIHNYLIDQKKVIPQYKNDGDHRFFVGAYVKEPQVGKHDWVVSFDLNSLYPHLIMQYNISPDTFAGKLDEPFNMEKALGGGYKRIRHKLGNHAMTPNGCLYRKDRQGFLGELMETMYEDRAKIKKMGLDSEKEGDHKSALQFDKLQLAKKIQLNAAYGALGNQWFRWFNPDYAESITMSGQLSIRWIEYYVNRNLSKLTGKEGDYVIASDTDSIYVAMEEVVKLAYDKIPDDEEKVINYLDKVSEEVMQKMIDKAYDGLAEYVNAYAQKMFMKREVIASKGIWTGKKRYILKVHNSEGVAYDKPKLKIMGIESVRSSTPMVCRSKIEDALEIIMNDDEKGLQEFVSNFRKEFGKLQFHEIARNSTLNGLEKYKERDGSAKPRCPIHVRGALVHNMFVKKNKAENTIALLQDGDKIKFCYLDMPNPVQEDVLSCADELPDIFGVEDYIDYERQFETVFEKPIRNITDILGWEIKKVNTLERFFA